VIDNVVWTDSWLSIAGAGCGLTGVGAGPDDLCSDLAMMAYLVPEQRWFEGRRAADGGDVL
jgi:hypothetical protein